MEKWWERSAEGIPEIKVVPPGPVSQRVHQRAARHVRGLSSQVRLFPVVFQLGHGIMLQDVDGNRYLDFSSGIYVASLGHGHPKVAEAIARWARQLSNCHDFTTPVKAQLAEKLGEILPSGLSAMQFYSDGTAAVEAGIRAARAITGRHEFISFFRDFHGKSMAAVSCARMRRGDVLSYGPMRAPGFYMVPRPDPYRPLFRDQGGHVDTEAYFRFYDEFIEESTVGNVAAFVAEPIQGWAGSVVPPEDFFPKLRQFCDDHDMLLFDDEVLTGMGRTGEWLCTDHWGVIPDIVTLGKSLGNGFPVTVTVVNQEYAEALDNISASSSYGGNPMACAAALASIEVIEEEGILENVRTVGAQILSKLRKMKEAHPIIGDARGKGFLLAIELVKDRETKEPFEEAGKLVYQKAFQKGLAWIPAGHILRMSPPLIMDEKHAELGLEIVDEAISEVEAELGYH